MTFPVVSKYILAKFFQVPGENFSNYHFLDPVKRGRRNASEKEEGK